MTETTRYRYPLKLPASLKDAVARLAKDDGVSLNQWITVAVAQKVGAVEVASEYLAQRAAKAKPGDLERYLDDAPEGPLVPGDELPPDWRCYGPCSPRRQDARAPWSPRETRRNGCSVPPSPMT